MVSRGGPGAEVLILTLNGPGGNAFTPSLIAALSEALNEATDPQDGLPHLRGVVICAMGRSFSTRMMPDLSVPGANEAARHPLARLCRQMDLMSLPVVVALQGQVTGPGAEFALSAHARIITANFGFSLPGVDLGLVPCAGGSQRLARIVGAAPALDILLSGRKLASVEALQLGLADHFAQSDLLSEAIDYVLGMTAPRPVVSREGLFDAKRAAEALQAARAQAAPSAIETALIDCIEGAVYLPLENGLALEAINYDDLRASSETLALIAVARAELRASQLPAPLARRPPVALSHLALIGTGETEVNLAFKALRQGLEVTLLEPDPALREAMIFQIAKLQQARMRAGLMHKMERMSDNARLYQAAEPELPADVSVVICPRDTQLQGLLPIHVPLIRLGGGEGALGLRLAPSGGVAELSVPDRISPVQAAAAVNFLRRLDITPVLTAHYPLVGSRVVAAGHDALSQMVGMGVAQGDIAAALLDFGVVMPKIELPDFTAPPRWMAPEEICRRWLAAMANEGFRLLDARVARRHSDIDFLLVAGYGFPRIKGGPMFQAIRRGVMVMLADLRRWAPEGKIWAPHPVVERLLATGRRIEDLEQI